MATNPGAGKCVRIYIGESDLWEAQPLHLALIEKLRAEGAAGATVIRGIAGFGAHSHIHTASILRLSEDLPIVVEWIDSPERVERILPSIAPMIKEGLITIGDVQIHFYQHRDVGEISTRQRVSDAMTRDVAVVSPDTPLETAVGLLVKQDYRAMPVVGNDGRVLGIVTNGDLVERGGLKLRIDLLGVVTAEQLASALAAIEKGKQVADVMTSPAVTIGDSANLADAAHLMIQRRLKRLTVVDEAGRLVGMLSRVDILRMAAEFAPRLGPPAVPRAGGTIGDVMRTDVPTVSKDADLGGVLDAIVATRLNRALVVDEKGRLLGVVSDSELLRRLSPEDHPSIGEIIMSRLPFVHLSLEQRHELEHARGRTAEELMDTNIPSVGPETPLGEAIEIMIRDRRKIVPVVDAANHLLGAVDRADLLRTLVAMEPPSEPSSTS